MPLVDPNISPGEFQLRLRPPRAAKSFKLLSLGLERSQLATLYSHQPAQRVGEADDHGSRPKRELVTVACHAELDGRTDVRTTEEHVGRAYDMAPYVWADRSTDD